MSLPHGLSANTGWGALLPGFVGVLVALGFILPPSCSAYLYWDDWYGGGIARANLDGRQVVPRFIPIAHNSALGIALTSRYIYIAQGNGEISRANLDGGGVTPGFISLFPTDTGPGFGGDKIERGALAVGGSYLYWPLYGYIGRTPINGGDAEQRFINTQGTAVAISEIPRRERTHLLGGAKWIRSGARTSTAPTSNRGGCG